MCTHYDSHMMAHKMGCTQSSRTICLILFNTLFSFFSIKNRHPCDYLTHRQIPWTDNDSSLLSATLGFAESLTGQRWQTHKHTDWWTDGWTDTTKCLISLPSAKMIKSSDSMGILQRRYLYTKFLLKSMTCKKTKGTNVSAPVEVLES